MISLQLAVELMLAAAILWFVTGYIFGRWRERRWWQDEMIRRRHAVYHWENAGWYWNEDEPPTPRDPAAQKVREKLSNDHTRSSE